MKRFVIIMGLIAVMLGCDKNPVNTSDMALRPGLNSVPSEKMGSSDYRENDSCCYLIKDVPARAWESGEKHMPTVFCFTSDTTLFPATNGKYFSTEDIQTKPQELWIKAWTRRWKVMECVLWLPKNPMP